MPLPVGAWIRVWRPVEIDAQPPTCAGVGASNADSNQARTAGENGASESSGGTAAAGGVSLCAVADMRRLAVRVVAVTGREFYSRTAISIECSTRQAGAGRTFRISPTTSSAMRIARVSAASSAARYGRPAFGGSSKVSGIGAWP